MKFGGTSVKDAKSIRNVQSIIKRNLDKKPIIVLSAMAGITDLLEKALQAAINQDPKRLKQYIDQIQVKHADTIHALFENPEISVKILHSINSEIEKLQILLSALETIRTENDNLTHAILSTGEILSSQILNEFLKESGIIAKYVDARKIMITTEPKKGIKPLPGDIKIAAKKHLIPLLKNNQVITTQGYIAATLDGIPTTLGRNGSDYSASLLGAALRVTEIQIWTDVDGILTADPTIVPYAKPLQVMTFEEACELAYFGARVLHPASIQPALEKGIPVRVLNSHFPDEKGTVILTHASGDEEENVRSIAYKEHITLITIESSDLLFSPGILGEFFQRMTKYGKHVYAVNKSATKLSLTLEKQDNLDEILTELNFSGDVKIESQKVIVSVVGKNLKNNPLIVWQIIKLLHEAGVHLDIISQMSSQISFMFIIDEKDIEKTVTLLHKEFIEPYWLAKTA